MKNIHRKYIDQTFTFAKKTLEWSFVALILLSVIGLIPEILCKYGLLCNCWSNTYSLFAKPFIGLTLIILFLSIAVVLALSLTTTSSKDIRDASIIDSPLTNLTVEQEQKIIALLKEKGTPTSEDGKMNRAKVAYILNALKDLGYISTTIDANTLRLWVIKETGYREDDLRCFKEALGRSQKNNIALRTKEMIEKMLSNGA